MSPSGIRWDAQQYSRFKAERSQPFHDLLARVPDRAVERAADLGCGDGELTRTLLQRWPGAEVWGVDSSEEMLERALASPAPPNLRFVREDLRTWRPPRPLDLIISNAVLQWVPDHAGLVGALVDRLAPEGVLAVQVPNNRDEAAHRILEGLVGEAPWAGRLRGVHRPAVESPAFYEERLGALGFEIRIWETVYGHRLAGPAEVIEWLKGTTLRPILTALSAADAAGFLAALNERVAPAYRPEAEGIVFPFRRLFFVAQRKRDRS